MGRRIDRRLKLATIQRNISILQISSPRSHDSNVNGLCTYDNQIHKIMLTQYIWRKQNRVRNNATREPSRHARHHKQVHAITHYSHEEHNSPSPTHHRPNILPPHCLPQFSRTTLKPKRLLIQSIRLIY